VDNDKVGEIVVNYLKKLPKHDNGPFLTEELKLVNGIAKLVGRTIDSKLKDIDLKEKNEEFLAVNEELKEKNEEYHILNEEYLSQNEELEERNEEFQTANEELEEEMAQRSQAQEDLQKSHEQQLALFDGIDDVIYVADPDTYEVLYFNKAARKIWGEDAVGKKCYNVLQNRDEPCPFCSNNKILGKNTGKSFVWEFQNELTKQWFRCADKAIKWNNDKMVRFELASDISELKSAQETLIENEKRFRSVFEHTSIGKSMTELDGSLKVNEAFCDILGYSEKELQNVSWTNITHPDDIQESKAVVESLIKGEKDMAHYEKRYIHKKGHVVFTDVHTTLFRDKDKNPLYFITAITDITERKEFEKQLLIKDFVFESGVSANSIANVNGDITHVNEAFLELWEYTSKEETIGKSVVDFFVKSEDAGPILTQLNEEGKWTGEFLAKTQKGKQFITRGFATKIVNEKGEKIGYQSSNIDVTDEINAKLKLEYTLDELKRSNKELEQFAYVASHDLQEPLRKVKNFAELFAKKYAGSLDEKANQYIKYMTSGTDRMQNLILDLLSFSRVATRGKEFVKTDIEAILKKVEENLQISIEENNAEIVYSDLPALKVDETQIAQVFQNLISNAIKFKSDGNPTIKIEAKDKKDHWQFSVIDNGIGMEMQYKERIFEVFQRLHTKEEFSGTGIGLAICKKIIERHNGTIWVESKPGEGSTFNFTIPKKLK